MCKKKRYQFSAGEKSARCTSLGGKKTERKFPIQKANSASHSTGRGSTTSAEVTCMVRPEQGAPEKENWKMKRYPAPYVGNLGALQRKKVSELEKKRRPFFKEAQPESG